ncbi:hypothetical protein Ancab_005216 [Ancistrocladus abbreviatus]
MSAFGACRGRILLAQMTYCTDPILTVWKLGDYNRGEWFLQYRICLGDLILRGTRFVDDLNKVSLMHEFKVLAFHPYKMDVLYFQLGYSVIQYNLKTRRQVSYQFHSPNQYSWNVQRLAGRTPFLLSTIGCQHLCHH